MKALPYFNVNAETTLQMDASKKGLGACLIQKGKVVCYASRALTKTEQNYQNLGARGIRNNIGEWKSSTISYNIQLPIIAVNMITTHCLMSEHFSDSIQGWIQDFPLGGANPHWRGCQPLTQVFFCENICKNERIWSCWGGGMCQKLLYVDLPLVFPTG